MVTAFFVYVLWFFTDYLKLFSYVAAALFVYRAQPLL
jgi:hypothetical protein